MTAVLEPSIVRAGGKPPGEHVNLPTGDDVEVEEVDVEEVEVEET
jgi:hypothetical protein